MADKFTVVLFRKSLNGGESVIRDSRRDFCGKNVIDQIANYADDKNADSLLIKIGGSVSTSFDFDVLQDMKYRGVSNKFLREMIWSLHLENDSE